MRQATPTPLTKAIGALASALVIGAGFPNALEATLVYPPDRSLLRGDGTIEVFAFRPAAAGPGGLAVTLESGSREYPVGPGLVRVKVAVTPGAGRLRLDGVHVNVFLDGGDAGPAPAGFEIPDAHAERIGCEDCHSIGQQQAPLLVAGERLCVRCHDDVTRIEGQAPVLHPPVAEGDCFACHKSL